MNYTINILFKSGHLIFIDSYIYVRKRKAPIKINYYNKSNNVIMILLIKVIHFRILKFIFMFLIEQLFSLNFNIS